MLLAASILLMRGDLAVRLFERSAAVGDYTGEVDECPFLDLDDGDWLGLPDFLFCLFDFLFPVRGEPASILLPRVSVLSEPWLNYLEVAA